jgi:hypothetical protein
VCVEFDLQVEELIYPSRFPPGLETAWNKYTCVRGIPARNGFGCGHSSSRQPTFVPCKRGTWWIRGEGGGARGHLLRLGGVIRLQGTSDTPAGRSWDSTETHASGAHMAQQWATGKREDMACSWSEEGGPEPLRHTFLFRNVAHAPWRVGAHRFYCVTSHKNLATCSGSATSRF